MQICETVDINTCFEWKRFLSELYSAISCAHMVSVLVNDWCRTSQQTCHHFYCSFN